MPSISQADPSYLSILLVEDNVDHAMLAKDALEQFQGAEISHVRDAAEALEACRRDTFAVVIVDYRLPDRSGVKLVHELRDRGQEGLVILLSSATRDSLAEAAMEAGADEYLSKSAGFEHRILRAIQSHIEA